VLGPAGRGVARLLDLLGDAARPRRRGEQQAPLLEDALPHLVPALVGDEPLHAGPELVVPVAVVVEDPQDRLERGEELLAGRELLERLGGVGVGARPPATKTRNPASTVPSSRVRVVATTPASLNIAWPQSVSQPEKLIL